MIPSDTNVIYQRALVAVAGASGVGKTALARALCAGEPTYTAVGPTPVRQLHRFSSTSEADPNGGATTVREVWLWDVDGHSLLQLIHPVYLDRLALALIVYDAQSDVEPWQGIADWHRLIAAHHLQYAPAPAPAVFLVAARLDRAGPRISGRRLESLLQDRQLGVEQRFDTSAKDGQGIGELAEAVRAAIRWDRLPRIAANECFLPLMDYLRARRAAGEAVARMEDLYRGFLVSAGWADSGEGSTQYAAAFDQLESLGQVRRLHGGTLVLLAPEQLDTYASALLWDVLHDHEEGAVEEERVRRGEFAVAPAERLADRDAERWLLLAMVEDLLLHDIARRESGMLVFPSLARRERQAPLVGELGVRYIFEGAVHHTFATLAVRLARCGRFRLKELGNHQLTYTTAPGGTCGLVLRYPWAEGKGELTLFFDERVSADDRFHFDAFVQAHLLRNSLPGYLSRQLLVTCPNCGTAVSNLPLLRARGRSEVTCAVCEQAQISLLDLSERLPVPAPTQVDDLNRAAAARLADEVAQLYEAAGEPRTSA